MSKPSRLFKSAAHRDENEPNFTLFLDAYHIQYAKGVPGDGYDLLVQIQPMEFWEIKNPNRPKSARKLTDAERMKQIYCHTHGIPYRVLEWTDQAEEILRKYNGG